MTEWWSNLGGAVQGFFIAAAFLGEPSSAAR